jgi:hypothetical protein
MYLSIAIGVINTAVDWDRLIAMAQHVGGVVFILFIDGFVFGFLILIIGLVARRAKNWARWIQLGLFIVGTPSFIRQVVERNIRDRPVIGTLGVVQFALQVGALFLIFTGNARDWFRREVP